MKKLSLLLLLLFVAFSSFAQFEISGELRPRFEYRDGYRNLMPDGADPGAFISQRSVLGITYKTELYTTKISFHDVRTWGSEAQKTQEISAGIREAWVEFNVNKFFKIKTGRQVLKYDNQRIIGTGNWNQYAVHHDAIKFSFKQNGWEIDFVGAYNQTTSGSDLVEVPYDLYNKLYKNLGILWVKKSFDHFSLATLNVFEGLRENDVDDETNSRVTSGLILNFTQKKVKAAVRGFYQSGKNFKAEEVSAHFLNATFTYKHSKSVAFNTGIEYFSGNDDPNQIGDKDNAFDVIYGGRHIFNGKMDYFLKPASTLGLGLINWTLGMSAQLSPKCKLLIDYHYFRTQKDFELNSVDHEAYLGSEIDAQLNIKISKEIMISALYGIMLPSDAMGAIRSKEADTAHYFMTMLTFKPTFFKN